MISTYTNDRRRQWTIKSLETKKPFSFRGPFRLRGGVQKEVGSDFAVDGGLGDAVEIVQFTGGKAETYRATIELFRDAPNEEALEPMVAAIESLPRRDPILKRPPRVRFAWGTSFAADVFVRSASVNIIRQRPDGSMAEVSITLSMVQAAPIVVEVTAPGTPPPSTTEVTLDPSETFELIAYRAYGDPMLGVNLRQWVSNARFADGIEVAGEKVLVPGREHPAISKPIGHESPALMAGEDLDALLDELITARSGEGVLPV